MEKLFEVRTAVDTSALTGESVPRSVSPGDTVLSGFVNDSGTIRIEVTKVFGDSSVSRILDLVEDAAARKAPTEKFISKFASVYTPIIVGIAAAIAFLPPLFIPDAILGEWVYRATCCSRNFLPLCTCYLGAARIFRRDRWRISKRHSYQGCELCRRS